MRNERLVKAIYALTKMCEKELDDYGFDRYYNALKEYPIDDVLKHLEYFYDCTKWPSINELRERLGTRQIDPASKAKMVAEEIMRMVNMVGCPHAAAADEAMSRLSPVAKMVVRNRGGWPLSCEMTNSDVQFRMREFEQSALVAIMSGKTDEYQQSLEKPSDRVTSILSVIRDPSSPIKKR